MGKTIWFVCAFHTSFLQACIRTARFLYIDSGDVIFETWYLFFEITFRINSSVSFRVYLHSFIDSSLFSLSISIFAYLRLFLTVQSISHQLNDLIIHKQRFTSGFQYSEAFASVSSDKMILFSFSIFSFLFSILLFFAFDSVSVWFQFGFVSVLFWFFGLHHFFQLFLFNLTQSY